VKLTVVVCTHDRAELLGRLLDSLASARRPEADAVELLIIANACSDETPGVLEDAGPRLAARGLALRWAEEPQRGKSHALNRALDMLDGDAAVFIDDDHRVDGAFLVEIAKGLSTHPDVNILCGRILPDWDGREPGWVHETGPYRLFPPPVPMFDAGVEARLLDERSFKPGGGNLIVRLPLLRSLGRFATELGPKGHDLAGGEDSEYLKRALDRGEAVLYLPSILHYHHVDLERLRLGRLMRLSYQRSRASARLHHAGAGEPLFLWRKLAQHLLAAILGPTATRRRYYLVRSAAALGEIRGIAEGGGRTPSG
jgi:glycosyltransferase involved in cell wall biosynthesis